jgi:AraC-like DNA-binding protein
MEKLQFTKESFTNYRSFQTDETGPGNGHKQDKRPGNFATYLTLFQSGLYRINDLNCYYDSPHVFKPNYTGQFSINFTRKGYFTFESFRRLEEEYASRIMLEKPGCEFKFIQQMPGDGGCTVFSFTDEGFELLREQYPLRKTPFFSNDSAFSTVITADASADLLHYKILQRVSGQGIDRFEIDCLVAELTEAVVHLLLGQKSHDGLPENTKKHHIGTIERAKEYLLEHFTQEVSLQDLARHCYVSPFHFTRLFKLFYGYSPFSYLQQVRLKQAEMLIRNTELPVADVCFRSGFKRLDYFSSTFAKQYALSPAKYRAKACSRRVSQ